MLSRGSYEAGRIKCNISASHRVNSSFYEHSIYTIDVPQIQDLDTAVILAETINAIVGSPASEGEPSDVGIQMTEKATDAAQV